MKTISREAIIRMTGGARSTVGGSSGVGGNVNLSGYATQSWVDENYLSIDFFSSLFKAYNGSTEVVPNGGNTSTITNIKAMFGFWTNQYLSALGQNSSGGGSPGTFSYLTVTNQILLNDANNGGTIQTDRGDLYIGTNGNAAFVKVEDICSSLGSDKWVIGISGDGFFSVSCRAPRFYFDDSKYLFIDNGTLKYYNGSTAKTVVLQ